MTQFSVHDAKTNLSKLIAEALEGGDVVIARGNVPAVRLVPVAPRGSGASGHSKERLPSMRVLMTRCPTTNLQGGSCLEASA